MATDCDYIIVGSGAGGGPLAANLARAGFSVILLEAGGDPCSESETGRLMYEVPIFHGLSTEYTECQWNFFVRHYTNEALQRQDTKYVQDKGGVWYPRAGALGGCTTHNAMITVVPPNEDWNEIAALTNDPSWKADRMTQYFERLENAHYVPRPDSVRQAIAGIGSTLSHLVHRGDDAAGDPSHGHGFKGWLATSEPDPRLGIRDPRVVEIILSAITEAFKDDVGNPLLRAATKFDPNDSRNLEHSPDGVASTPLAVLNGKRNGPREFILQVQKEAPGKLTVQKHALASRILFEGNRAVGVEYLEGKHLYKADPAAAPTTAPKREIRAKKEVIVAGGAFNSPQLLMLSGIGDTTELRNAGVTPFLPLPGVGQNLQDRYEIGVITKFKKDFDLLSKGTFALPQTGVPDPAFDEWKEGKGLYVSNGTLIGVIKRSKQSLKKPDLYIFGLPGYFPGYKPGYSADTERFHNMFTWAILKAHTNNTAGFVTLRSADPTDTPQINFKYFSEGNDTAGEDLEAVVEGVKFARAINKRIGDDIVEEIAPGKRGDTDAKLREFIQAEAWGHHASCTNKIGADGDKMAVLDSRFRVRGTQGLRVVDASVFPRIPGYFIVSAVYMISEKAFDVIRDDA